MAVVQTQREGLPIIPEEGAIMEAIAENDVVLIVGMYQAQLYMCE